MTWDFSIVQDIHDPPPARPLVLRIIIIIIIVPHEMNSE